MSAPIPSHRTTAQATAFEQRFTLHAVTTIMTTVVALAFLFGFGNVWALARDLGVTPWVAPLVAPAVDLSVIGLLLSTWHLALHGARPEQTRPACRLLIFSSLMTLALNVTEPVAGGHYGRAAFDTVGPLLLIGWSEVGPGLLQAISTTQPPERASDSGPLRDKDSDAIIDESRLPTAERDDQQLAPRSREDVLLERALEEDARHWELHQRPISAETLRKQLHVGAAKSRMLVSEIRTVNGHHTSVEARQATTEQTIVQVRWCAEQTESTSTAGARSTVPVDRSI
ncbi:SpdA protein [Streptomyces sp. NPDC101175]|uniref:SpdA protein n=1 Tax=Streptomyces sp. NPDC101175 TaxID=3366123 RepID=UPI003835B20A